MTDRLITRNPICHYLCTTCFAVLLSLLFCPLKVFAAPQITLMTPSAAPVGAFLVIIGTGFGASQGASTVAFNGTPVTDVSWSPTELDLLVPSGTTTGNVVVNVGGVASNGRSFTVLPSPIITGLSSDTGAVGSSLTITGTNFTGGGRYTPVVSFSPTVLQNLVLANPTSFSDTSVTVTVPLGAISGDIVVNLVGGFSNALWFNVTSSGPSISSVSPTSGIVGSSFTITGSNFGSVQGSSTIVLNGTTVAATSWSSTSIVATVPSGATSGSLVVTVGGTSSNSYLFLVGVVAPQITTLSPTTGAVGTSITISGNNFGASQSRGMVTFNGVSGISSSWSATSITVPVPTGASTGNIVVTAWNGANYLPSNGIAFSVPGTGPSISTLSTPSGSVGSIVTINGANFGQVQGTSTVTFNGTTAFATNWSPTSVAVLVPSTATSGNVVTTVNGAASNGISFTVTSNITTTPSITSIYPAAGPIGAYVLVTGTSFGSAQGTSKITFNGTSAQVVNWSNSQIAALVPSGTTTGPVIVSGNGLTSNSATFSVVPPPAITSLSPGSGFGGQLVTISGSSFGSSQQTSTVLFNGSAAIPTSWSNTSIQVHVPLAATSGNVLVIVSGVQSNAKLFTVPASITGVFPTSGAPGASVTIFGDGFGTTEPSGSLVSLNGASLSVTSWNQNAISFNVPSDATSGQIVANVGGVSTNSIPFTVASVPTLINISPTTGVAGTIVTIAGSGFGVTQSGGSISLGSTYGVVSSWSDTQIVAAVASGAKTGNVQVTQGGVTSNSLPFNVTTPVINSISISSGGPGTAVTISGSGFGGAQGSGNIWLGTTYGVISSWSSTQIVAAVASTAQSGTVKVLQGGVWSNTVQFTVPTSTHTVTITPSMTNMVVGQVSASIQALNGSGNTVTGLTWKSSNSTVVSLSASDPPVLTALAPGHVTITASDGVADVIVSPNPSLPPGTIKWSVPGDGSGVSQILPAVPSPTGIADVFAFEASGNVLAVTGDGSIAWSATANPQDELIPDFAGGLLVVDSSTVKRLDGLTGQQSFVYSLVNPCVNVNTYWSNWVVSTVCDANQHPRVGVGTEGTTFVVDGDFVIGLDSITGSSKFQIHLAHGFIQQSGISFDIPSAVSGMAVSGDSYLYLTYDTEIGIDVQSPGVDNRNGSEDFGVLRIGPSGDSTKMSLAKVSYWYHHDGTTTGTFEGSSGSRGQLYSGGIIPNGADGVLVAWQEVSVFPPPGAAYLPFHFTVVSNTVTSDAVVNSITGVGPGQQFKPALQTANGTFVGTGLIGNGQTVAQGLISCNTLGSCSPLAIGKYEPALATADGGIIAIASDGTATTFGASDAPLASTVLPTQSWSGSVYETGSLDSVALTPIPLADTFWALTGGNASGNGTAIEQVETNKAQQASKQLPTGTLTCNYNRIELLTSASPSFIFQNFLQTYSPLTGANNDVVQVKGSLPVTGSGQTLTFTLKGIESLGQGPFSVETERFDSTADTISVVTLVGHPLSGWRYWRVYSNGTNDVVVETGAADTPAPGLKNYFGFYYGGGMVLKTWEGYLRFVQKALGATQGNNPGLNVVHGLYDNSKLEYILQNVCQSTSCN